MDIIFNSVFGTSITLVSTLIMLGCAVGLGLLVAGTYMLTHRSEGYTSGMVATIVLVPAISASIILLVGTNTAAALSLAGAAAVIRFRTTLGSPKDLTYLFFALAIGLGCGTGYVAYVALFAIVLMLVAIFIEFAHIGRSPKNLVKLRITVPEDINYPDALTDVMETYAEKYRLNSIKTTEFGSLCELTYIVLLKRGVETKRLIDAVRERNGNLSVQLTLNPSEEKNFLI